MLTPCLGLQPGHLSGCKPRVRRKGLTFSLPQMVYSESKPRFHSRIEPLQKLVHVCEVCLLLLLPAPWKEAGAGLGAARACGSSGSAPGCSPGPSTGRGPRFPLPRTEMRKSNFNPQHKAYKINCSAPPQIICRVLNGILLTGNASIQEKGSKVRL